MSSEITNPLLVSDARPRPCIRKLTAKHALVMTLGIAAITSSMVVAFQTFDDDSYTPLKAKGLGIVSGAGTYTIIRFGLWKKVAQVSTYIFATYYLIFSHIGTQIWLNGGLNPLSGEHDNSSAQLERGNYFISWIVTMKLLDALVAPLLKRRPPETYRLPTKNPSLEAERVNTLFLERTPRKALPFIVDQVVRSLLVIGGSAVTYHFTSLSLFKNLAFFRGGQLVSSLTLLGFEHVRASRWDDKVWALRVKQSLYFLSLSGMGVGLAFNHPVGVVAAGLCKGSTHFYTSLSFEKRMVNQEAEAPFFWQRDASNWKRARFGLEMTLLAGWVTWNSVGLTDVNVTPLDRWRLGMQLPGLVVGYGMTRWMGRSFKPAQSSRPVNSLRYYTVDYLDNGSVTFLILDLFVKIRDSNTHTITPFQQGLSVCNSFIFGTLVAQDLAIADMNTDGIHTGSAIATAIAAKTLVGNLR